jgi:hypothetical protein
MKELDELFSRGVASCIDPDKAFHKKIEAKIAGLYPGDIVIKLGVDPTRPDIHLGHAVISGYWRKSHLPYRRLHEPDWRPDRQIQNPTRGFAGRNRTEHEDLSRSGRQNPQG